MLTFKRNMNNVDRAFRILVGIALIVIGPVTNMVEVQKVLEVLLGVIGTFALLSGIFAYCILYEFTKSDT